MTSEEMLAEVNTAIAKILSGGQSYRIGNRQMNRADLGMLRQMKRDLEAQTAASDDGVLGNFYTAEFDRR